MATNRAISRIVSAVSGCVLAAVAVVVAAGTASASDDAVPLVSGRWRQAVEVPGTATLNAGGAGQVSTVSCPSAGNCSAAGRCTDSGGQLQVFVVARNAGTWGNAIPVPGLATLNHGDALVYSISCPSAGNCSAGGSPRRLHQPFCAQRDAP